MECIGDVDYMKEQTNVIFERESEDLILRYPDGQNIESELQKVWFSDKFLVFGVFSDMGAGLWFVNKKTLKFSYMQSKDLSWVDAGDFSSDQYVGTCSMLKGMIQDF
jgi:hypothetical protein